MKIFSRSSTLFLTHVEPGRKRECYRFRIKIIIYNIRHADINHLHSHYHSDLHVVRDRNIFRQSSLLRQSHSTLSLSSGIRNCVNEAAFSFLIHPSHDAFNREILVDRDAHETRQDEISAISISISKNLEIFILISDFQESRIYDLDLDLESRRDLDEIDEYEK